MSEWIKCSDRLPKDDKIVVVICDSDGMVTARFTREYHKKGEWFGHCCCFHEIENPYGVTHWAELPEPPDAE